MSPTNEVGQPMLTVWKYLINDDAKVLNVQKGAKFLSAGVQYRIDDNGTINGGISLWFLADPTAECETRVFHLYGTGQPIPHKSDRLRFLATVMTLDGTIVSHVFEVLRPS